MRAVMAIMILCGLCACQSDKKASSSEPVKTTGSAANAPTLPGESAGKDTAKSSPSTAESLDQSKPENVVEAMFAAARQGDGSNLPNLCDPSVSKDRDVQKVCGMEKGAKDWDVFVTDAKNAKIVDTKVQGDTAQVEFTFGAEGKKERVKLMMIGDKWYLASM